MLAVGDCELSMFVTLDGLMEGWVEDGGAEVEGTVVKVVSVVGGSDGDEVSIVIGVVVDSAVLATTLVKPYEEYSAGGNESGGTGELVASAERSTDRALVGEMVAEERMERALVVSRPLLDIDRAASSGHSPAPHSVSVTVTVTMREVSLL